MTVVLLVTTAMVLNRLAAFLLQAPFSQALVVDSLLVGLGIMLLRSLMRSALWVGGTCWGLALLSAALPAITMWSFLAVLAITTVSILLEWGRIQKTARLGRE